MQNEVEGELFVKEITVAYDVIEHQHRNLFVVPFQKVGKTFVQELARLFAAQEDSSSFECIPLKAARVMCALLLQKPHKSADKGF